MLKNIVVLCITIVTANANIRILPGEKDQARDGKDLYDAHHGIAMGVLDSSCDDAKISLETDWLNEVINYTCFGDRTFYQPQKNVNAVLSSEHIPEKYSAQHKCMNESIEYEEIIPTFGTHRPLWAVYGEYTFLPKQRWLHNLEHGAVAMVYHPCANENEVNKLKRIVKGCLYRHVITPYNLLSPTRPLALVTWGNRLEMSSVESEYVFKFIKEHALKGPEKTHRNGQYEFMLKEKAEVVSDLDDTNLCRGLSPKDFQ